MPFVRLGAQPPGKRLAGSRRPSRINGKNRAGVQDFPQSSVLWRIGETSSIVAAAVTESHVVAGHVLRKRALPGMHQADRLYREHAPSLVRYLQRQLGDRDLAEDVAQETFLRALRHDLNTNARSWLFTTATNILRDNARRDVRQRAHLVRLQHEQEEELDQLTRANVAALVASGSDDDSPMHRALQSLSERDRTALLLSEEGLSYNEIAVMLALSMQSVGTTLTRARKRLLHNYEVLAGTVAAKGDADAR